MKLRGLYAITPEDLARAGVMARVEAAVASGVLCALQYRRKEAGSAQLRAKLVAAGCLLFAMVAVGRYADLFTSLLVRSAVFVAVGVVLFLVGNFYARGRRRAQGARP